MKTVESTYKGHPILEFWDGEKEYPIARMGTKKIKAVLDNIEVCKAFIQKVEGNNTPSSQSNAVSKSPQDVGSLFN